MPPEDTHGPRMAYRTPTVTSIGGRNGSVQSADGLIDLQVGPPKEIGGPEGKINPEELFAAGYAACFHSAVKGVASARRIAIGKSTVDATVTLTVASGTGVLAVELSVRLPGANPDEARGTWCVVPTRGVHIRMQLGTTSTCNCV